MALKEWYARKDMLNFDRNQPIKVIVIGSLVVLGTSSINCYL